MSGQVFARDVVPSQDLGHQGVGPVTGKFGWEVSAIQKWATRTDESGSVSKPCTPGEHENSW